MKLKELLESKGYKSYKDYYKAMMKEFGLDPKTHISKLTKKQQDILDAGWKSKKEKKEEE